MAQIPIALQLYSVRKDCAEKFQETVEAVAKMGYEGVDFAGYHDKPASEIRKWLDDLGLKVAGAHTRLDLFTEDNFQETVDFHKELGCKYLVIPWIPEEIRKTRANWLETAKQIDELSDKLAEHGMRTGYHNHTFEFTPLEGETPWDIFFGNTKPEVIMQVDTGNMLKGGGDPIEYLKKYPGRATTVHMKEYSETNDKAVIGEGDVAWKEVIGLTSDGKTEWYIIEQESYAHPPLECADVCLKNLKKLMAE